MILFYICESTLRGAFVFILCCGLYIFENVWYNIVICCFYISSNLHQNLNKEPHP